MSELLATLARLTGGTVIGDESVLVSDVVHDHRDCAPGAMFVARRGLRFDGHDYVGRATGCAAACVERTIAGVDIPQLVVADCATALGLTAAAVHGRPFEKLRAVGVTGTNGKTTVTRLLGAIAAAAGMVPAVAGTLGWSIGDVTRSHARTSPEASDLHRLAASMVEAGVDLAAFEVSSHGISLGRVVGAHFSLAAFTNLSQDHLDFHGDMEEYFSVKERLFTPEFSERGVVWVDDPYGARLAESSTVPVTTVGTGADVTISDVAPSLDGTRFVLRHRGSETPLLIPLLGSFNVENAAIAAVAALEMDVPMAAVTAGLALAPAVNGRFELIGGRWPFSVVVDYAHTPDGIATVVAAARQLAKGRVLVVMGAGGDRDPSKRPAMGREASRADLVIVTTDNPRSEAPEAIAAQVESGITAATKTILDRRQAIASALAEAAPGDVVLILGKGHETVQEFSDHSEPFNDAEVVRTEGAAL